MKIGDKFLPALSILIKFYYVCNLDFPDELQSFYNFLTAVVMQIENPNRISNLLQAELNKH